jgi:hypothetical protein
MMGATRKPGCVTVLLCFCCNDLNLNLTATLVRRPAIIEGDEEHNRDEGAEKNGKVGGGGNGHWHALTGEEEGLLKPLIREPRATSWGRRRSRSQWCGRYGRQRRACCRSKTPGGRRWRASGRGAPRGRRPAPRRGRQRRGKRHEWPAS